MKLLTIYGTRPEYIRLNILINKLDDIIGKKIIILLIRNKILINHYETISIQILKLEDQILI